MRLSVLLVAVPVLGLVSGGLAYPVSAQSKDPRKDATDATRQSNAAVLKELPFGDTTDFDEATRGLIAPLPNGGQIKDSSGRVVWDPLPYEKMASAGDAPDTVNPSLWRNLNLLLKRGLYEVVPGLYQVRSADSSNLTVIEGEDGLIVYDPCMGVDNCRVAMDLYRQQRGNDKPIVAVIYSHSHIDHYGGVRALVDEADVKAGKIKIVAPENFVEEVVSENVYAGNHMGRRASYQYGNLLPKDPKGNISGGLGLTSTSSPSGLILPTDYITRDGQKMTLGGLTFEFLLAQGSEAPAEMFFYVEELKAMTTAEDATHTLHNLYTLRGAKVRDALGWSNYIDNALQRWGNEAEVLFAPHHWPVWGKERIHEHLSKQRDIYKYLNDQVLRLANHGYNMVEAAEMIKLPDSLAKYWSNRGYYGSVNHGAKAVWTYYLGYWDGNPSRLHPLPPVDAGRKFVEYMGGADAVLERAKADFEAGNYRWVSQVLDQVVSADPGNQTAKDLMADAYEQLGYQQENGTWRNIYLTGTKELREGVKQLPAPNFASPDTIRAMPSEMFFQFLAIRLNGPKANGKEIAINVNFTDEKSRYALVLENSVLHYRKPVSSPDADITMTRKALNEIILKQTTLERATAEGRVQIDGDADKLGELLSMLDTFDFWWNVSTPHETTG